MILLRASRRYALAHRWLSILSVLGVALGVAVIVAVDLANGAAQRSFTLANEFINGRTTHRIIGGPAGVDESIYRDLRVRSGFRSISPVIKGEIALQEDPETRYQLLGIDAFAEQGFRAYTLSTGSEFEPSQLVATPNGALVGLEVASRSALDVGASLSIVGGATPRTLTILGIIEPTNAVQRSVLQSLVITDIATAQSILGTGSYVSYIDLIIQDATTLDRIRAVLPSSVDIVTAASGGNAQQQMARAFETNLLALSLLALVIGMFLIYNTVTFSVVRRREQLGVLRTVGVTRRQLFLIILIEALILGTVATCAGMFFGIGLAHGLVGLVTRTINDLYFAVEVERLVIPALTVAKGFAVGIGATILAGCMPAWEATTASPGSALRRSVIERRTRQLSLSGALVGVVVIVIAVGCLIVAPRNLITGFVGLFLLIAGYALATPLLMVGVVRGLKLPISRVFGVIGKMAARTLGAALSRTGVAVAALAVATSATIGVGIMITSFRGTVTDWLTNRLQADVYLSAGGNEFRKLDPKFLQDVSALDTVASVSLGRWTRIESEGKFTQLFAVDIDRGRFKGFEFKTQTSEEVWPLFTQTQTVIVSEPYAYREGLTAGDHINLRTAHGYQSFLVAGVYYDYGSDSGVVTIHRDAYLQHWGDPTVTSATIYLQSDIKAEAVIEDIKRNIGIPQNVRILSAQELRAASLEVFDRTFAVTTVLRSLAIIVAVVAILSALMAIQLERSREFGVLRVLGMTPGQLFRLISIETGLMGSIAAILSIPIGVALAWVLIEIINRRSFGWSMQFSVTADVLGQAVLLAIGSALVAAIYPAIRCATARPADALHEE